MIPLLFRPRLLAIRNRWLHSSRKKRFLVRDFGLIAVALFVGVNVYFTARSGLQLIKPYGTNHIDSAVLLSAALTFLFILLLLSNLISALSSLFIAEDLDLLTASSLSPRRFLLNKLIEIHLSSTWVLIIFGAPAYCAFANVFSFQAATILSHIAAFAAFTLIPSFLAIAVIPLLCVYLPSGTIRAVTIAGSVILLGFTFLICAEPLKQSEIIDLAVITNLTKRLSWLNQIWSPASLTSSILVAAHSGKTPLLSPLAQIIAIIISSAGLAYYVFERYYFTALSLTRSAQANLKLKSIAAAAPLGRAFSFVGAPSRALMVKELKFFSRDVTQILQLIFLMILCMAYLYNVRFMGELQTTSPLAVVIWKVLLVISNLAMGAFLIIALSTRFVYTSISREGRSFWIIQSAPLQIRSFLLAKMWCWLIPVTIISAVVLCTGAMAVEAEPELVWLTLVTSLFLSYGIVGLAIGFGAIFANFEWENPSHLSANLGGLAYMLSGSVLTAISLIPIAMIAFVFRLGYANWNISSFEWGVCLISGLIAVMALNAIAVRWGLAAGQKALTEKVL